MPVTLPTCECVEGLIPFDRITAIYAAARAWSGDTSLPSVECVAAKPPLERWEDIYCAIFSISSVLPAPSNIEVTPDGLGFDATFDAVSGDVDHYEWRLDSVGGWTSVGLSTSISGSGSAGNHILNVRAVSISSIPGEVGNSAPFSLVSFTYTSTIFGGSSQINHAGNLTGAVDGTKFLLSFWLKLAGGDGTVRQILNAYDGGTNRRVDVFIDASNILHVKARNSASTIIYEASSGVITLTTADGWMSVASSFDLSDVTATRRSLFINGVNVEDNIVFTDSQNIDYLMGGATPAWNIFGIEDNTRRVDCLVSEFYFTNEWLDLSANLTKFRSVGGSPVDLGTDGSLPTGNQPWIYLHNPFSTFQTNLGSGGNFVVVGSPLADGGADKP